MTAGTPTGNTAKPPPGSLEYEVQLAKDLAHVIKDHLEQNENPNWRLVFDWAEELQGRANWFLQQERKAPE